MDNLHTPPSRLISESEARTVIQPHTDWLISVYHDGFERWREFELGMPHLRAGVRNRTRSGFINDMVVQRVSESLEAEPRAGMRPFEDCGFLCLDIDQRILLRFKKLDAAESPCNIPTGQQETIAAQGQLEIPGFPPAATWVTAGYRLRPAGEALRDILMTCHYNDKLVWRFPLFSAGEEQRELFPFGTPTPPPIPPAQPQVERPKVRAKKGREKEA